MHAYRPSPATCSMRESAIMQRRDAFARRPHGHRRQARKALMSMNARILLNAIPNGETPARHKMRHLT